MESLDALTNNELQTAPLVANFKNAFLTGARNLFLPFAHRPEKWHRGHARQPEPHPAGAADRPDFAVAPLHYDSGLNRDAR